jgi:hypothetical protein
MDKKQFVERAPIYYALAIVAYFKDTALQVASLGAMEEFYSVPNDDDPSESYSYIGKYLVLDRAVEWLVQRDVVSEIADDFGPSIFTLTLQADAILTALEADKSLPFSKYGMLNRPQDWLRHALRSLNNTYDNLEITPADFKNPDQEWEPLPLDRTDPALQKAIGALDDTIEQVRADNGYNATVPEERNYVLDGLSAVSKRLKEATAVSVPYIQKYALEPLGMIMRRFKDAALGVAAAAARQAVIEFLKQHGIKLLQGIFGP